MKIILILIIITTSIIAFDYQVGWPQNVVGGIDFSSPILTDMNGDDTLDVLIASQGHYIYLWNHRGEPYPNWPKSVITSTRYDETSSPSVGDIDNDGQKEIVYSADNGNLYAWEINGNLVSGFPVNLGDNIIRLATTLEDINNDDTLEILVGTGNNQYRFYVFRHNGVQMWSRNTDARIHSTPATGDIDNDGDVEIVFGNDGVSSQASIYALHHNNTIVSGWPRICGNHVDGGPALADIDNDGDYEIFVGSLNNFLYGLDYSGTDLPNWPKQCGSGSIYEGIVSSPAVGDIDNDSTLEIVVGRGILQSSYGVVFAFKATGQIMNGFPINITTGSITSSPAIIDIDSDNDLEIITGGQDGKLYAFHHNSTIVNGFPIDVGNQITSSPAVADIDLDGDIEIAVGAKNDSMYIWDLPGLYNPNYAPWSMFHHDPCHTGRLPRRQSAIQEPSQQININKSSLTITPNPTKSRIRINIEQVFKFGNSLMTIYNSAGQQIEKYVLKYNEKEKIVDIRHIKKGIYFIEYKKDQTIVTKKIIKL